MIDQGNGYETLYAHLSQVTVTVGDEVTRDSMIGYLGNTGRSSGPHLYYSIYQGNEAIDPKPYLGFAGESLSHSNSHQE
jgi:murein DD-endopeptidase MepM/ murein hydrolase activator NlpD